jgi:hypothetical protein
MPPILQSTYSSGLTRNSSEYTHQRCTTQTFKYEAIEINVSVSGYYGFSMNSDVDTYGFLYRDAFDPFDPSRNQIASDDDSCGKRQFRLESFLQIDMAYTLVVTTFRPYQSDVFTLIALSEAGRVNLTRLGECSVVADDSILELLLPSVASRGSDKWSLSIPEQK